MKERKFDVLEEVEKQYQANLKESPIRFYDDEKWKWYIEQLNENPDMRSHSELDDIWSEMMDYDMMEQIYDIDWPEDSAALAAEMEQMIEYLDDLFKARQILVDVLNQTGISSSHLDEYYCEKFLMVANDYLQAIEFFERQIMCIC